MGLRKTVAEIVSDAALQLGLVSAPIADPYSGASVIATQLAAFLKSEGRKLARKYPWSAIKRTHTFVTVASTATYALPTDLGFIIDGTAWDRTNHRRLVGPLSDVDWEYLQSGGVSSIADAAFRVAGDVFNIFPTPSSVRTIAFEYQSTGWTYGDFVDDPEEEEDPKAAVPVFDGDLMTAAIKLAYLKSKGYPYQSAQDEYDTALAEAQGNDAPSPAICITPGRWRPVWNAPGDDGTWGT